MDQQVRLELADLMRTGGRNLCTMPRMLGIMLRQRCPQADGQILEIEQALSNGCVGPILAAVGPVDEADLSQQLAAKSGMDLDRARWAVETWVHALDAADPSLAVGRDWSSWNRLDVSEATAGGSGVYQRAISHLIAVGLAGGFGGIGFGLYLMSRGEAASLGPWREALEEVEPWAVVPAVLALGFIGGLAGGFLGWMIGGGRSWTYDAHGGTTLGRLVLAGLGAFHGATAGVLVCVCLIGLIGVLIGGLLGAAIGAFLGLLIAEGISRFWW